jgi:hypothetical protein
MFVQLITGRSTDNAGLEGRFDAWQEELRPGAIGYVGSTGGIAPDGTFFTMARFESEEAAQKNSERPEQGAWFAETQKYLEDVTFTNSTEIDTFGDGGSNDAGFVQVIKGRASDRERMRELGKESEAEMRAARPDVIGGLVVWHGDGNDFTQVVYFTSREEAREGEKNAATSAAMEEMGQLMEGEFTFIDLEEPHLN